MFPRLSLAAVVFLPVCLLARPATSVPLRNRAPTTTCGTVFTFGGCVGIGSGGPLDVTSVGPNTQTNGEGNGHPAPTGHSPQATPFPNPPATSQTNQQQEIQSEGITSSRNEGFLPSTTSVSDDRGSVHNPQTSEPSHTSDTTSMVGILDRKSSASQSLTQLPSSSSSLGGALQGHGTSKGRIVAAVLGSILGVIVIVATVFLIRRRRRRHSTSKPEVLIATRREQEIEPTIHHLRYQRNLGFYLFNHTHQPDDGDIDVERRLSRTSYSSSPFSLTTRADTIMEEKLNFRLDHPL